MAALGANMREAVFYLWFKVLKKEASIVIKIEYDFYL